MDELEAVLRQSDVLRFLRADPESGSYLFVRQGLEYRAADPARRQQGLYARLEMRNGEGATVFRDTLNLDSDLARRRFAKAVLARLAGERLDTLTNDLLLLGDSLAEQMRLMVAPAPGLRRQAREPTAEEAAAAQALLEDPGLMLKLLDAIRLHGIVGEEYNALLLHLAYTSRITPQPVSIVLKGESSSGKSWLQGRVIQFMPEESYFEASDITPQALFYLPGDLSHMILAVAELPGADKANYSIRTAQSEGKLRILVTVRDKQTNEPLTKVKEVQGPVMFCITTTASVLNLENETRQFSLFTDDSVKQTKRIRELQYLAREGALVGLPPDALELWRNAQRILKPLPVLIPYVRDVGDSFPVEPLRVRRDWGRFCTLIESITLLHQFQRRRQEVEGQEWLVATLADYAYARELAQAVLSETITSIGPRSRELFELMKADEWTEVEGKAAKREFSYRWFVDEHGLKRSTVQRWMAPLYENGLAHVVGVETRGGRGRITRWILGDRSPAEAVALAEPRELARRWPDLDDLASHQAIPFEPEEGL